MPATQLQLQCGLGIVRLTRIWCLPEAERISRQLPSNVVIEGQVTNTSITVGCNFTLLQSGISVLTDTIHLLEIDGQSRNQAGVRQEVRIYPSQNQFHDIRQELPQISN